jgi:hypothetical protein
MPSPKRQRDTTDRPERFRRETIIGRKKTEGLKVGLMVNKVQQLGLAKIALRRQVSEALMLS